MIYINVKNIDDSLDYILENNSSVARFGDGEIDIISGNSIPYQEYDKDLADNLRKILQTESTADFLVCLPDVFENMERYNDFAVNFWRGHLAHYEQLYKEVCTSNWYGSTFISRPYIDLLDKTKSHNYFNKIKNLWKDKDLLIVEGETSRSGVGNDLFANAKSIKRIICPSKNAYRKLSKIEEEIINYADNRLVLVMLGPTAKVLAYNLCKKGINIIDIGHIDSEYEWYKMQATHKVKLSTKHTAEFNYDNDITFEYDENYNSQILVNIN
ncbi:SP_1767 family glycosyltransferase [Gemella sp. GH3]|uniref:SP_1767 family glycosyltransferase n=1 Tax=unclassified Gemella TaxID=2624949 RepID=UPI0015D07233|nr:MULTISPECIES: SP_1767 family glycosyltransferase [unclassified Gemella]MBF0714043.1 SP_1767 family glycosyltransferase [Gemella sp. GH3.1]NYS50995.1 SP_1767 family glycosyltransferase [Gemella sp. GH3]